MEAWIMSLRECAYVPKKSRSPVCNDESVVSSKPSKCTSVARDTIANVTYKNVQISMSVNSNNVTTVSSSAMTLRKWI